MKRFIDQIERMKELVKQSKKDAEGPHSDADDILCDVLIELGQVELVEEYNKVHKWYA